MAVKVGGGSIFGGGGKPLPGMVVDDPLTGPTTMNPSSSTKEALAPFMGTPVAVATQVVTGAASAYGQYKAGEDAKDIARANAELIRKETAEKMRVMREENRRAESLARARAAASGLSGASTELYINALIESGRQDVDWLRQVGESQESIALKEGRMAYHQARAAMWGTIGSTIGSSIATYSFFR